MSFLHPDLPLQTDVSKACMKYETQCLYKFCGDVMVLKYLVKSWSYHETFPSAQLSGRVWHLSQGTQNRNQPQHQCQRLRLSISQSLHQCGFQAKHITINYIFITFTVATSTCITLITPYYTRLNNNIETIFLHLLVKHDIKYSTKN